MSRNPHISTRNFLSRRALICCLLVVVVALSSGLGLLAQGERERQAQPLKKVIVVKMTADAKFDPAKLTIMSGDTVEWINTSKAPHTVTGDPKLAKDPKNVLLPPGAKPFHSGNIKPGAKYAITFKTPGMYRYICVPHELKGMLGEIDVKPALKPE